MGKQSNILSFDDAKRELDAQPSAAASKRPSLKRSSKKAATARPSVSRSASDARRTSTARSRSSFLDTDTASKASSRAAVTSFGNRSASSVRNRSTKRAKQDTFDQVEEGVEQAEQAEPKRSRIQEFRRKLQKNRADKKFTKQFGGSSSSEESSSGSRAAVYKGEMGSNHRRSARMQDESTGKKAGFSLAQLNPIAALSKWRESPKFIIGTGAALCVLLTCWFLYTPTQQLYQSVRERDRLEAEYAALEQRNASLEAEVSSLQTDSGIEDRAHEQFGWVPEGYETANVKGLSETDSDDAGFTANIVPGSIEAPDTWYSPVLDVIFGVK